jgi:hypothetical protein
MHDRTRQAVEDNHNMVNITQLGRLSPCSPSGPLTRWMLRVCFGSMFFHNHFTVTIFTKEGWLQVATAEEVYVFQGVVLLLWR